MHVAGGGRRVMKMKPLSVLMFCNEPVRAGVEEHILQLLTHLDRQRFKPLLACRPELADLFDKDLPADVEVCRLTLDSPTDWCGALKLARFLRKHVVQILHSHMFRASLFASPIGWMTGVPVVVETAHVRELWRKGWKASFVVDRMAGAFIDQTIAVSNAIARYLIDCKGIAQNKVAVIPTAPALSTPAKQESAARLRKSLGIEDSDPLVVLAGRLEPQKGHRILIEAIKSVFAEFPRVQLVFLGEGSLRSELERQVRDSQLNESIRFAGFQRNVREWFAAADLSVLPSFYEGLPMTALESLAEGCPIVATAVDGTPEVVRDGETGLLVPPGDVERLSDAICRMLRDREFALRTALAGQREVLENFSVKKLIARTQDFYLNAWENHLRKSPGRAVQVWATTNRPN